MTSPLLKEVPGCLKARENMTEYPLALDVTLIVRAIRCLGLHLDGHGDLGIGDVPSPLEREDSSGFCNIL